MFVGACCLPRKSGRKSGKFVARIGKLSTEFNRRFYFPGLLYFLRAFLIALSRYCARVAFNDKISSRAYYNISPKALTPPDAPGLNYSQVMNTCIKNVLGHTAQTVLACACHYICIVWYIFLRLLLHLHHTSHAALGCSRGFVTRRLPSRLVRTCSSSKERSYVWPETENTGSRTAEVFGLILLRTLGVSPFFFRS